MVLNKWEMSTIPALNETELNETELTEKEKKFIDEIKSNHSHPTPTSRQLMHRKPRSSAGNHLCQVTPRWALAYPTRLNDAGKNSKYTRAFGSSCTIANFTQNNPMPKRTFSFIIRQRQMRVIQHRKNNRPIIKHFYR